VGGSGNKKEIVDETLRSNEIIHLLLPASWAGPTSYNTLPRVPLRYTLGFMLSPVSRA
jgi:hypothetical protein